MVRTGFPLRPSGAPVGAIQFHSASDAGSGSLLLRSGGGELHRGPVRGRSGEAVRGNRLGADLADPSEYGIDNRNQHDLIRSMPGGVAGVRQMIADFHRRGVRVLFPMMMWDQGTRQPEQLGIWNGITPRDAEATRRGATIEPAFAPFFVSGGWQPMVPTLRYGVYASRCPHGEQTLFKAVNRNEYDVDGDQWRSDESSCNPGSALFRFLPRRRAQAGCPGCGALVDSVSRSKPKGTEPSSQPTGN
jgi:hypothetical protein